MLYDSVLLKYLVCSFSCFDLFQPFFIDLFSGNFSCFLFQSSMPERSQHQPYESFGVVRHAMKANTIYIL